MSAMVVYLTKYLVFNIDITKDLVISVVICDRVSWVQYSDKQGSINFMNDLYINLGLKIFFMAKNVHTNHIKIKLHKYKNILYSECMLVGVGKNVKII